MWRKICGQNWPLVFIPLWFFLSVKLHTELTEQGNKARILQKKNLELMLKTRTSYFEVDF